MVFVLLEVNNTYGHPLINRLVKNYRHYRKNAKRTDTDCFRIYDRDIPEFSLTADYYAGRFLFQYYRTGEDDEVPAELKGIICEGLHTVFGVTENNIFWKVRKKRALLEQHEKMSGSRDFFVGKENGMMFYINLKDYIDTGLFLDHRPAREMAASAAKGKAVLNLYSYTGSFSVYCAKAGAAGTLSVDMSNTYTEWASENMKLNGFDMKDHQFIREDCMKYLDTASKEKQKFDIIIIDPPTISRSKKLEEMFDVNRDHALLINKAAELLRNKESLIFFSTNSRKFKLDTDLESDFVTEDVSSKTIPEGFRDKKIHKVYLVKLK
ncbi:MAG: class I SAM-dependent methyltransferase [Candidatus Delongbacteria bacterium]|nr:class I SAM-dependent methyltransferase [Candidatus Delongbacteria bacterium]